MDRGFESQKKWQICYQFVFISGIICYYLPKVSASAACIFIILCVYDIQGMAKKKIPYENAHRLKIIQNIKLIFYASQPGYISDILEKKQVDIWKNLDSTVIS